MKLFPNPTITDPKNVNPETLNNADNYGADLRDYFAGCALQGVVSNEELRNKMVLDIKIACINTNETITESTIAYYMAKEIWLIADSMMKAR
jgi:hypothetical protein